MAVAPKPIRRAFDGKPLPPDPWEPGEERPKPDWILVRLMAVEAIVGMVLTADEVRCGDSGEDELGMLVEGALAGIEEWAATNATAELDLIARLQIAVIVQVREVINDRGRWLTDLSPLGPPDEKRD